MLLTLQRKAGNAAVSRMVKSAKSGEARGGVVSILMSAQIESANARAATRRLARRMDPACFGNRRLLPRSDPHRIVENYFLMINPYTYAEFAIPGAGTPAGFADIVELTTPGVAVYDIKGVGEVQDGIRDVANYIAHGRIRCDPDRPWIPGTNFPGMPPVRVPNQPPTYITASLVQPGVILWRHVPEPDPEARHAARRLADEIHEWGSYEPGELRDPQERPGRPTPRARPGSKPPDDAPGQLKLPLVNTATSASGDAAATGSVPSSALSAPLTTAAAGTPSESEFRRWGGGDVSGTPFVPVVGPSPPMQYTLDPRVSERLSGFLIGTAEAAAVALLVAAFVAAVAIALEGLTLEAAALVLARLAAMGAEELAAVARLASQDAMVTAIRALATE